VAAFNVRSEIERFADLQRQLEPLVRSVQRSIKTAGERIDRVPDQRWLTLAICPKEAATSAPGTPDFLLRREAGCLISRGGAIPGQGVVRLSLKLRCP
jgi:hypothetical protein